MPEDRPNHWAIRQWPRARPTSNVPSAEGVQLFLRCELARERSSEPNFGCFVHVLAELPRSDMSDEEMNDSQAGHRDGIDDINSVYNPDQSGGRGAICILQTYGNAILDSVNKGAADQLVRGGIMFQSFEVASFLLDDMTRINQVWYTKEDHISPFQFRLTQEQLDKEKERDENIKKMLTQMEVLQEHMKGTCGVFRVEEGSFSSYSNPMENQGWNSKTCEEGFYPRYWQRGGNQGWNHHKEVEQRRCHQDLSEQYEHWRREDEYEENHTHSSESPKSRGSANSPRVNDLLTRILDKVEGLDDLLKGMKDDFSSLNNKVNSHGDAIKILEGQMGLRTMQLKQRMEANDEDRGQAFVTRSRKEVKGDLMGNEEVHIQNERKDMEDEQITIPQYNTMGPQSDVEKQKSCLKVKQPLPKIPIPYQQRLKKKNEDEKFKKFLSVFKTLSINLPLVEALLEMPGYAKFMKELVTKKELGF
ncbi:uncharacterized protein [Solanum tuberosum]|uniref:uncharacterized protein n=1 Tax=Solanum tuberosum TaxID=4113 RepID=UPI00073A2B61|nr:PREDICTED: uncharacterized protein LOC107061117 [Solanum tuberosum]